MNSFALFTDVSVCPQRKLGVGGYLLVPVSYLEAEPHDIERDAVSARLRIRRFTETSSTRLEVQTVLWALENAREELTGFDLGRLRIYTDSQCVAGLLGRRVGLINSNFIARSSGRPLANAPLYHAFYEAYDRVGFQLIKVTGHSRACSHDTIQRIFSYVDSGVRKELKLWMDSHASSPI
jgi:ribonuclease HI